MTLAAIRYRVVADRLEPANKRGVRQFVILGAGLDSTAFQLPMWAAEWKVFEVDHPIEGLNEKYFRGRSDGLQLSSVERILTAMREV